MPTVSFREGRAIVIEQVLAARKAPAVEEVTLTTAAGRVLAHDAIADRDYPSLARSVRDGFAVHAADLPGTLRIAGEVRAGGIYEGSVELGEAVEIMTGAPVPEGADAVVMVEHVMVEDGRVRSERTAEPGQFINARGGEAKQGSVVVAAGSRLDYAQVAMLAATGLTRVPVFAKPRVAVLATGDEIVDPSETPAPYQIRNSNVYSIAAQVERAGGAPEILPVARDNEEDTRRLIERGLEADLLLLSGGVSAGKYDLVEKVLAEFGAEFYFDRVKIQPGQPLVFGRARGKFFFGLPGNPGSTMVTFEVFARAAVELLAGQTRTMLPMMLAELTKPFGHKTGLTRFLPACLSEDGAKLTPVPWQGSGDVPALSRCNAFLVADADRAEWQAGELMRVILK